MFKKSALEKMALLCLTLMSVAAKAETPVITLGTAETYCVVYCYVKVPFTITHFQSAQKMGRVLCEFDAEVRARLPVYNGEMRSKIVHASPTGIFKNTAGVFSGEAEMDTGIRKEHFVSARLKNASCHL